MPQKKKMYTVSKIKRNLSGELIYSFKVIGLFNSKKEANDYIINETKKFDRPLFAAYHGRMVPHGDYNLYFQWDEAPVLK